ncbi:MAG: DUF5677 domain-containing protein [Bacillota bacterium]
MPPEFVGLGLISDFGLVPEDQRDRFLRQHFDLVEKLFYRPVGRLLAFYPESPAAWLVPRCLVERDGSLNPDTELGRLRNLVVRLLPGKDEFAGRVRAVPLNRLLKHGKIKLVAGLPVVELLPRYPHGLTDDERYHVESMARNVINMAIHQRPIPHSFRWAQYFWRHNFDLVPCRPIQQIAVTGESLSGEQAECLEQTLTFNSKAARDYLDVLRQRLWVDLYDPIRDEILFGLFARLTRLYCLLCDDPLLWARDIGGILLRCLADTAITFAYLAKRGTADDFKRFIEYGHGQRKLLMLHLQDNYPDSRSLEGMTAEEISQELGGFMAELTEIELGHWLKEDTRKLAQQAGMERVYRLVYAPASSDLHGSWLSLKQCNLLRCGEPLHRFHYLPALVNPPLVINTIVVAQELYCSTRELAIAELRYPPPQDDLKSIGHLLRAEEASDGSSHAGPHSQLGPA